MKRGATVILLFLFAFISAFAQSSDFRRNIGLDSLVRIMQQNSQQKIYYNRDESGLLTFTVDASSPTLQDDISRLLRDKGYIISHSEGVLFVLKGTPVKESLPSGWFVIESEKKDEKVRQRCLAESAREKEKKPISLSFILLLLRLSFLFFVNFNLFFISLF